MAKYTTQIRTLVENGYDIFDFDYPIFDENYRGVLEQKIINRYYFREIGFETVGQFKFFLKTKLNEIMPYYNDHYKAVEVFKTFDPYKNKNVTTTDTRTNTQDVTNTTNSDGTSTVTNTASGTTTGKVTTDNTGKTVFSDTPQARLQGGDYATSLTEVDDAGTTDSTGSSDSTATNEGNNQETINTTGKVTTIDEYTSTIAGHDGMKYPSDILKDLRATFINLDIMVLDELNDLFMNIY